MNTKTRVHTKYTKTFSSDSLLHHTDNRNYMKAYMYNDIIVQLKNLQGTFLFVFVYKQKCEKYEFNIYFKVTKDHIHLETSVKFET